MGINLMRIGRSIQYTGMIKELLCEGRLAKIPSPNLFNMDIEYTTPMVTLPFDALVDLDSEMIGLPSWSLGWHDLAASSGDILHGSFKV